MSERIDLNPPPVWQIWRNPIVWRYAQSRLRPQRAVFWLVLTLIVTAFVTLQVYLTGSGRQLVSPQEAARLALIPLITIQGIILMLMGTGSVATGIVDEKLAGVLDYQRMAPLTPLHKIVGYLFGLPIREYLMFALTLPFLVFLVWRGAVPLGALAPVYLVFFTSVLLYHLTGMVAGMVTEKWRWSARLTQALVVVLYLILPQFSRLGFVFFEFLTVRPVLAEQIRPLLGAESQMAMENLQILQTRAVPFFTLSLSGTLFSLIIQGIVMALFVTMLLRKWVQAHRHPLSKVQVVVAFFVFQLLSFGNLWPTLTQDRSDEARAALALPIPDEAIATAIPLVFVLLTAVLAVWLLLMVVPDWNDLTRGERRRTNLRLRQTPWRWDESSAMLLIAGLAVATGGLAIWVQHLLERAGYYASVGGGGPDRLLLPLALTGALLILGWTLAVYERGKLMLSLLLLWLTPMLAASIAASASSGMEEPALWIAAISPATLVIYATALPNLVGDATEAAQPMSRALFFGFAVMTVLALLLWLRWRALYRKRLPGAPVPWF